MRRQPLTILANFFLLVVLLLLSFSPAQAQTEVRNQSTTVTATVIDRLPPSTPILISPADDTWVNTGYVKFVWQASTDNWQMDHYILYLNGSVKFDNIPLIETETSEYALTYDSDTTYYTLRMKINRLSDGSYTWKIIAQDYQANQASSVTWDFTVDTKAPSFIITQIEEQAVEITAGNVESVPTDPIVLTANEPSLSGTGEANSSVELTVTDRDGIREKLSFTIDSSGKWSTKLDTLPRDQVVTLDFLIIDPVGNLNLLNDLPLILYTPVVIIPLPSGFPSVPKTPTQKPPVIEIPILPPAEYFPPVIRKVPKQIVYYVRNYSATIRTELVTMVEKLWMISVLLALMALPVTKLITLILTYRLYLSADLFKQFLWFIGWWREQAPAGIVLDRITQAPISQSLVFVSGKTSQQQSKRWVLLTNQAGIFPTIKLPDGEYRISIQHPNFFFPSLAPRPAHLDWQTFYTGAVIQVKNGSWLPLLAIPVESLKKQQHNWFYALKSHYLALPSLSIPMAIMALVITATFPGFLNILSTLVYFGLLGRKFYLLRRKNCQFLMVLSDKSPQSGVVIAATVDMPAEAKPPVLIRQTGLDGTVDCYLKPAEYQLQIIDFKHRLTEGNHQTQTEFEVGAAGNYLPLVLVSNPS